MTFQRLILASLGGVVLIGSGTPPRAACPLAEYRLVVTMLDHGTGRGIPGASVYFFLDEQQGTWANGYETRYPDFFTTDADGQVQASAFFLTRRSQEDTTRCNAKPRWVTIVASGRGYLTKRLQLDLRKLASVDGEGHTTVELPDVQLLRAE